MVTGSDLPSTTDGVRKRTLLFNFVCELEGRFFHRREDDELKQSALRRAGDLKQRYEAAGARVAAGGGSLFTARSDAA